MPLAAVRVTRPRPDPSDDRAKSCGGVISGGCRTNKSGTHSLDAVVGVPQNPASLKIDLLCASACRLHSPACSQRDMRSLTHRHTAARLHQTTYNTPRPPQSPRGPTTQNLAPPRICAECPESTPHCLTAPPARPALANSTLTPSHTLWPRHTRKTAHGRAAPPPSTTTALPPRMSTAHPGPGLPACAQPPAWPPPPRPSPHQARPRGW